MLCCILSSAPSVSTYRGCDKSMALDFYKQLDQLAFAVEAVDVVDVEKNTLGAGLYAVQSRSQRSMSSETIDELSIEIIVQIIVCTDYLVVFEKGQSSLID